MISQLGLANVHSIFIIESMIHENVNESFEKMGVLLMLDSPEGLEFGIDNISWKIGSKFKGVKMIPLGTHIIAYSLKSENHMFKMSQFLLFREEQKILVYRWNEEASSFLEVRGEEGQGYREGVKHFHFDSYLGPYPQENLAFWSQTTRYITKPVLEKLDPIDKIQQFQQEYSNKLKKNTEELNMAALSLDDREEDQAGPDEDDPLAEAQELKQVQNPGKFKVLSDTIYYSDIPRYLNANPSKITEINLDKTPILKRIITKEWKNKQEHLLGQLQYSYVHFVIGEGEESLSQWKKLVDLFVNSESAYLRIQQPSKDINLEKLIMDFIPVFYDQLNQFPTDFFEDQLSKGNFTVQLLKRLHEYSKGQEYSPKIRRRIQKLLKLVEQKFKYVVDSGDEQEEDMPIVVSQTQSYF